MKLYRIERYEDINSREAPQYAVDDLHDNSRAIGVLVEVRPCIHDNYTRHTFITYDDGNDVEYDYCNGEPG